MSTTADGGARIAALYQERILEHYRHPRHKGTLARATGSRGEKNPLRGDAVAVAVCVVDGVVQKAAWTGTGCSIMQATASMLMEFVPGQSREAIEGFGRRFDAMLASGAPDDALGELAALVGVAPFAARHKCARLPWKALLGAVGDGGR